MLDIQRRPWLTVFKAVANNVIYQDGVMRMSILGTIVDTTPRASVVGLNL